MQTRPVLVPGQPSNETRLHIGTRVVIRANDNEFWSFVDGWRGQITSFQAGLCVFEGPNPQGIKVTLLVQPEHLDIDTDTSPLKFCHLYPVL